MENKFEKFYCKSQGKNLSVSILNESNYRQYENDMFCPCCHQARLSFVLYTTNRKPHLRTSQKSLHSDTCSHKQKRQPYKTATEYLHKLTTKQLKNQLKSTLRYLSNEQHNINDIHKSDNKNTIIGKSSKICVPKLCKILRKKSLKGLEFKQGKSDELFIFYGKAVKLNFNQTQGNNDNYLNITIKLSKDRNIRIGIIVGNRNCPVNSYTFYNIAVIGSLICKKNKKGEECFYIKLDDENYEYVLYEPIKNHKI